MRMGIGMLMNGVRIGAVEFTFFFTSFSAGTGGAHVKKDFRKNDKKQMVDSFD
jgi:hypothetical protein